MGDQIVQVAISVAVANLIAGAVVLFGWYHVQKRFTEFEFPAVIQRITNQIQGLEAVFRGEIASVRSDIGAVRADMSSQSRTLERHDERLGHHGRRLDRLEDRADGRRERDLDDTRAGR